MEIKYVYMFYSVHIMVPLNGRLMQ